MEIKYNVTGAQRKALVQAASTVLGMEAVYQGTPSFAYALGVYNISQDGTLTGADDRDLVADLQGSHGFVPVIETYDIALPQTDETDAKELLARLARGIPWEAELGGRVSPYRDWSEPPAYGVPEPAEKTVDAAEAAPLIDDAPAGSAVGQPECLTIDLPAAGYNDATLANLERLVASKARLIKKAIGQDAADTARNLAIERTGTTLRFPWFSAESTAEEVTAYTQLVSALWMIAKEQKRVTAQEKAVENEKYAFRCFLLRLGFIGDEYAAARKILLAGLAGNSSFKSGAREPAAGADTAANINAKRANA